MNKSENINELATALSKMQASLHGAVKDAKNPFFNANYADLESIWESIRKPLTDNGLAIVQVGGFEGDKYTLITMLTHSSGQWISGAMTINPVKQDPQSLGSALTYMRRYGVAAIIGQVQVDDDGNGATIPPAKKPVTKPSITNGPIPASNTPPVAQPGPAQEPKRYPVTEAQIKRLFAIKNRVGMSDEVLKQGLEKMGLTSTKDLTRDQYDYLVKEVEAYTVELINK